MDQAQDSADGTSGLLPIPQVPTHLFGLVGNLPDVDSSFFARSIWRLADLYGPIFQLDLLARKTIVISSYELLKEVMDDDRFEKFLGNGLVEVRAIVKDGLFTAYGDEPNWALAHRILMPVFGPIAIRHMFDEQLDIASQMVLRWDRLGADNQILASDDFTKLAFDTIGLCAFNHRFNNFYTDGNHPFVNQMADSLIEAGKRASRTKIETGLRIFSQQTMEKNIKAMHDLCDEIIEERIQHPQPELHDLLNTMLNAADPTTGEKLPKENIRFQMVTFLIAGHETTSGTLSFLFYHLLKNPNKYHKAQKEVDQVLGDDAITLQHLPKLKYVDACIKEALRFQGPITAFSRHCKKKTDILAGKYPIDTDKIILVNLRGLHHDPAVWGNDHDQYVPERMLEFDKIPPGAFKPFGTGMRACIGRAFSEQEMLIIVALILQRFQVDMADPSYNLALKSTMTVKPLDFYIKVKRRPGKDINVGLSGAHHGDEKAGPKAQESGEQSSGRAITILYGSNAGTCKSFAEDLASEARSLGFAPNVSILDAATEEMPKDITLVIITPSYEGKPPDNAKKFVSWLEAHSDDHSILSGRKYAVFGVGNSEWASTFHRIPKLVDSLMGKLGAEAIAPTGFADVKVDPIGPWEAWREGLWARLQVGSREEASGPSKGLNAVISKAGSVAILGGEEMSKGVVKENRDLGGQEVGPAKKHMELELRDGVSYRTGDYLVVLPLNHHETITRVLKHFQLLADDVIEIKDTRKEFLKAGGALSIHDLLASRVELNTPVTQRQLSKLAALATSKDETGELESYGGDDPFLNKFLKNRHSILDVLEDYPSVELPFAEYLDMLQPLAPRQYSIASSPLAHTRIQQHHTGIADGDGDGDEDGKEIVTASITYDVHSAPAWSSSPSHPRTFHGVCSSYLSGLTPGSPIRCFVRATNAAFHLPVDPAVPVIMVAAGTGVAPMRGFVEERAAMIKATNGNSSFGPALLYFGCRDFEYDYIHRAELEDWESLGAVSLRPCFSKRGPSGSPSYHYTSDRIWAERAELSKLFRDGAKVFLCGSAGKLAKSSREVCEKIWLEAHPGSSQADAHDWFEGIREVRYVSDVFG